MAAARVRYFSSSLATHVAASLPKHGGISSSASMVLQGKTEYGKRRTVTLIPGDGIGPELCNSVRSVFR